MGFWDTLGGLFSSGSASEGGTNWGSLLGSLGSAGMGVYGLIANAQEANARKKIQQEEIARQRARDVQQTKAMDELYRTYREPLDVSAFYTPSSDIEKRMLRNTYAAELASRGVPMDSAYASGAIAESMAKSEVGRLQDAQAKAIQNRQVQVQGAGAGVSGSPGGNASGIAALSPAELRFGDPFKALADYYGARGKQAQRTGVAGSVPQAPSGLTYDPRMLGQQATFGQEGLNLNNIQAEPQWDESFYPEDINSRFNQYGGVR